METNPDTRTYGWYATHHLFTDGTFSDTTRGGDPVNAPSWKTNLKNLEALGVKDLVPSVDNYRPLLQMWEEWEKKSWTERMKEPGHPCETLHWILNDVLKDTTLAPEMFWAFFSRSPITVIENAGCPEPLLRQLIERTGTKDDTSRETKGGEMTVFALYNRALPPHLVDLCARKTRKASIQKDVITHPNVTRETLVHLVKDGKSDPVKRDALLMMFTRGWLNIE